MSGDLISRRQASLRLLAAVMSGTLVGCSPPQEEILPYAEQPEGLVPGVPLRFATALPLNGYGRGVICTSFEGRPTKVEGNPAHPASLGATDAFAEAVDRVSTISTEKSSAVKLSIDNGSLVVSATSPENGTAVEELEVRYLASSLEIGFNSRYLLDITEQIQGEGALFVVVPA